MSKSDLNKLSLEQLKNISKISGICYLKKSKEELVSIIDKKFKELDNKEYKRIGQVGTKGKDGLVYIVQKYRGKKKYAQKHFRQNKSIESMEREISFLQKASENGISPKVLDWDIPSRYITMELLGDSLFDVLKNTQGIMSVYQQREFVNLIKKLDELGIYHGDPSPLNFLFDKRDKLKVIDFGFAESIDEKFISKHKTKTPNKKFMLLGFILKMKTLGVDIDNNYNYIKKYIDKSDLEKCGISIKGDKD